MKKTGSRYSSTYEKTRLSAFGSNSLPITSFLFWAPVFALSQQSDACKLYLSVRRNGRATKRRFFSASPEATGLFILQESNDFFDLEAFLVRVVPIMWSG